MKRLKISILFGTKPNFDEYAFKYFILYVNQIQSTYEFNFPDIDDDYPFTTEKVNFDSSHKKVISFTKKNNLDSDHFITIITNSFNNNYFFNANKKTSVITTDVWDKHFSPPSLFEYLLHCIFTCLIYSQNTLNNGSLTAQQSEIDICSHTETKGCLADLTRLKKDDKVAISLGYICDEHKEEITTYYGENYLKELEFVIKREWIGNINDKESVAYNLKHIFKFNILKDSGFNKTWLEKVTESFYQIPGSLIGETMKILITAFLTYYLIKWGIIDND
jgi:hypothetical protein